MIFFPLATASISVKNEPLAKEPLTQVKVDKPRINFDESSQKLKQVIEQTKKFMKKRQIKKPVSTSTIKNSEQWRKEVSKYSWDVDRVLRLIQCESGGNPNSTSRSGIYHGLFQFDKSTWQSNAPEEYKDFNFAHNGAVSILVAYETYSKRGFSPWPVCGYK